MMFNNYLISLEKNKENGFFTVIIAYHILTRHI